MMQNGYIRKREVQDYMVAGICAAIANGQLTKIDKELFTAEDFIPKKIKEFTEAEEEEMLDARQELARLAVERSERFDRGVITEEYGRH